MASNEVCPTALWHKLPVLSSPRQSTYFYGVADWSGSQATSYVTSLAKKTGAASIAFAVIALVSLLAVAGWRIFRRCKHGGSGRTVPERASTTLGRALRVLAVVLSIIAACLTIWAMSQVKKDTVNKGFEAVGIATRYTTQLSAKVALLSQRLSVAQPIVTQVDKIITDVRRAAGAVAPDVDSALSSLSQGLRAAGAKLQSIAQQTQQASRDIDSKVTQNINQAVQDTSGTATNAEKAYYGVMITLLLLGLFMLIFQIVASVFAHRTCLSVGIITLHVFAVLYFVGTIVAALAVGAANDVCPSVEDVVLHQLQDTRWAAFGDYYLNTANKATLADTLKKSDIVDLETVNAQITLVTTVLTDPDVIQLSKLTPELSQFVSSISGAIQGVTAAKDDLLAYGDARVVRPLYLEIKSFGCCVVPNNMANLFNALSSSGWMILILCWVSCILLSYMETYDNSNTNNVYKNNNTQDDPWLAKSTTTTLTNSSVFSTKAPTYPPPSPFDIEANVTAVGYPKSETGAQKSEMAGASGVYQAGVPQQAQGAARGAYVPQASFAAMGMPVYYPPVAAVGGVPATGPRQPSWPAPPLSSQQPMGPQATQQYSTYTPFKM